MENTDELDVATRSKLGVSELRNEVEISYKGEGQIAKVLTANAHSTILSAVVSSGEVKFDGEISYEFLVVLDSGEISLLCEKSKFSQIYEDEKIKDSSSINIECNIIELGSTQKDVNRFSYSALLSLSFYDFSENSGIKCATVPEDVFARNEEFTFNKLVCAVNYDSIVSFDLPKDSKTNKILFVKNCASIKSVIPAVDYFIVAGEVYSFVVYQTEEGQIRSVVKENSFSEEVEAKGSTKESNIQARIYTKPSIINYNEDKNCFDIEVPITIFAQVFNKESANCVADAYSLTNDVQLTTSSLEKNHFFTTKQIDENIVSTFSVSGGVPQIDKILAVTPTNISLVNQIVKDEEVLLEGIASINLIYYTEDEEDNDILNSIDVEVPYSINFKSPEIKSSDNVCADIAFGDINVKNRHSSELEILAEIKINYNITSPSVLPITTDIVLGEEKPLKDYGLEIYLAKSTQTIWDVAKELNVSTETLIMQNGELNLPLEDGQKIIAYSQRVVDFN